MVQSCGKGAVEDEVRHPLGMLHGVRESDGTTTGDPQEREPVEPGRVHDRLKIVNPGVEADVGHVALGPGVMFRARMNPSVGATTSTFAGSWRLSAICLICTSLMPRLRRRSV